MASSAYIKNNLLRLPSFFVVLCTKKNGILRAVGKVKVKGKGKGVPRIGHEGPEGGVDSYLYSFFNLSARWGGVWSTPRPGHFIPVM